MEKHSFSDFFFLINSGLLLLAAQPSPLPSPASANAVGPTSLCHAHPRLVGLGPVPGGPALATTLVGQLARSSVLLPA